MVLHLTREQFLEYQQQWTQPVADGDVEGQKKKLNAAYWVAYCCFHGTGGAAGDISGAESRPILEQVIQEQDRIDGGNYNDNTGKHRSLLAYMLELCHINQSAASSRVHNQTRSRLLNHQAIPRLEIEVQEGGNDENYQEASYHLGMCLYFSHGVDKDEPRGIHWLKNAAELGHKYAQQCIELRVYLQEPSAAEIVSWLQQIADQNNNVWAQLWLGIFFEGGRGVQKDLVKSVEWYNKAIAQGNEDAGWFQQKLLDHLSPEERSKTMGCVARNQNIGMAKSLINRPDPGSIPLGLWAHALESFQHQENPPWEAPSPTFLSLKDAITPQLQE